MAGATDAQFSELREMSTRYLKLSGDQGYLYCTQPERAEFFAFGDGSRIQGIKKALEYQRALLAKASLDRRAAERGEG